MERADGRTSHFREAGGWDFTACFERDLIDTMCELLTTFLDVRHAHMSSKTSCAFCAVVILYNTLIYSVTRPPLKGFLRLGTMMNSCGRATHPVVFGEEIRSSEDRGNIIVHLPRLNGCVCESNMLEWLSLCTIARLESGYLARDDTDVKKHSRSLITDHGKDATTRSIWCLVGFVAQREFGGRTCCGYVGRTC